MVALLRVWTKPQRFRQTVLYKGKPAKRTSGSHVTDMAELRKCIVLCMTCEPKLNKRKYGYERARDIPICRGKCDGCGQYYGCATFLRPQK